jgi:hypothetical protein
LKPFWCMWKNNRTCSSNAYWLPHIIKRSVTVSLLEVMDLKCVYCEYNVRKLSVPIKESAATFKLRYTGVSEWRSRKIILWDMLWEHR